MLHSHPLAKMDSNDLKFKIIPFDCKWKNISGNIKEVCQAFFNRNELYRQNNTDCPQLK